MPHYRIVKFTDSKNYEYTGETWPFGEDFEGLNAYLQELTSTTGFPHGAEVVWQ